LNAQPDG